MVSQCQPSIEQGSYVVRCNAVTVLTVTSSVCYLLCQSVAGLHSIAACFVVGHELLVDLLLTAGADVSIQDKLGGSALLEACKAGRDDIITILTSTRSAASLGGMADPIVMSAWMCKAVFEGDLMLLRRFLNAGADPDCADYDQRTALHIAAADGKLSAVSCQMT